MFAMNRIRPIAAALALFFSATAANASLVMSWSFTGTGTSTGINGSGTFEARLWNVTDDGSTLGDYLTFVGNNSGAPFNDVPSDFYVMTGATGTINNNAISLLPKYAATYTYDEFGDVATTTVTSGFQGNDNVVLEPNASNANKYWGNFTNFGVSFVETCDTSLGAACTMWNLFVPYNPGSLDENGVYAPSYQLINSLNDTVAVGTFKLETTEGGRVEAVPVPGAAWLLLSGVGSFFLASRRRFSAANAR